MLLFWVADNATDKPNIGRQTLATLGRDRLALPREQRDHHKQFHITVARWQDEQLIVEAGPQRSMQVLVRSPLAGGSPSPILQAIRTRATHAAVGLDQLPAVQARRRGQTPPSTPQSEPNVSLHLSNAVAIARGPSLPASWTHSPVRRGAIWPNLISFTILAIAAVGCGIFIVTSGTIIGLGMIPQSWLVGSQRSLVLYGEGILLVGVALWMLSISLRWLRTLQRPQDYFFLVTPRYAAEVKGQKVEGVALADVRNIHRSGGGNYGWQIVLAMRNGKKTEYDVGNIHGPARDLYAYVLAALNARRPAQPVARPAAPFGPAMESDAER